MRIAAIEVDDLETPVLMIKAFASGRQMTEPIESEARRRVIVALRREGDGQPVTQICVPAGTGIMTRTLPAHRPALLSALAATNGPSQDVMFHQEHPPGQRFARLRMERQALGHINLSDTAMAPGQAQNGINFRPKRPDFEPMKG
jgi:hypothetical protein